ncbi:hypothetical protein [Gracilimonas sp. BCB1]|uniref:hypothetical protein n=1 Tax=Gracilimonas sp. BCB1 TaxID=3152362 RepID=UPI0032D95FF1
MRKLTPSEYKILDRLIFPEPFEVIQEETQLQYGELRDDLINLMNSRLIQVVNPDQPQQNETYYFDSDNVQDSTFRITNAGINHIKKTQK